MMKEYQAPKIERIDFDISENIADVGVGGSTGQGGGVFPGGV